MCLYNSHQHTVPLTNSKTEIDNRSYLYAHQEIQITDHCNLPNQIGQPVLHPNPVYASFKMLHIHELEKKKKLTIKSANKNRIAFIWIHSTLRNYAVSLFDVMTPILRSLHLPTPSCSCRILFIIHDSWNAAGNNTKNDW